MENLPDFNWITWVFSGIGTEMVVGLFATLLGGFVVYKVIVNQRVEQKQTAGKNSKQYQSTNLGHLEYENNQNFDVTLNQSQKAGDNSEQIQIGESTMMNGRQQLQNNNCVVNVVNGIDEKRPRACLQTILTKKISSANI